MCPNGGARHRRARGRDCRAGWIRLRILELSFASHSSLASGARRLGLQFLTAWQGGRDALPTAAGAAALLSVCCCALCALSCDWAVAIGTAVAEKLPDFADFRDHIEIEIGDHHFIFVAAGLRDYFAARIAEVAFAVELADAPRLFDTDAVDCADEVTVRHRMRGLLEFP